MNNIEITGNLAWLAKSFIWIGIHFLQIVSVVVGIAAALVIACVVICCQPATERTEFIHRHDKFKPTTGNALLIGFAGGLALMGITVILISYFLK